MLFLFANLSTRLDVFIVYQHCSFEYLVLSIMWIYFLVEYSCSQM